MQAAGLQLLAYGRPMVPVSAFLAFKLPRHTIGTIPINTPGHFHLSSTCRGAATLSMLLNHLPQEGLEAISKIPT
jgi:hypothetical protein